METHSQKSVSDSPRVLHDEYLYRVAVAKANFDFHTSKIDEPKLTGRHLLEKTGFTPAEDHLLFQVLDNGALEERRLDETIELREKREEPFIVFSSDRSFRVEINERRFEWGAGELSGLIAKQIARVDPTCTGVWLQQANGPDRFIEDADVVKLDTSGVEKLRVAPVFVLWIEDRKYRWPDQSIATAQIAKLGGWDPSLGVQEIDMATGKARTLKPGEVIDLKDLKTFAKRIGWRRG